MDLVHQAIRVATLPVRLHELPQSVDVFVEHAGRRNEKKRSKQTELFLQVLDPALSADAQDQAAAAASPPAWGPS